MQKNEENTDVRLAATVALYNALEFAHSNFSNDSERNYLMQVLHRRRFVPRRRAVTRPSQPAVAVGCGLPRLRPATGRRAL